MYICCVSIESLLTIETGEQFICNMDINLIQINIFIFFQRILEQSLIKSHKNMGT